MEVWKNGNEIHFLHSNNYIFNSKNFFTELLLPYFQSSTLSVLHCEAHSASQCSVGKDGFEPPNSGENRFTVCCRWPLDYLPDGNHYLPANQLSPGCHAWSQRRESNPRPADYKSAALPTELLWPDSIYHTTHIQRTKTDVFIHLFFWEGKGKRIC